MSPESLGMYCFGNVMYQGNVVAENAVFTLVSYNSADVAIDSGHRVNWDGQGLLIVWSNNLESFESWNGVIDADSVNVQDLNNQFSVSIGHIFVDGDEVSSVTLRADTMERMGLLNISNYRPQVVPVPDDDKINVLGIVIATILMLFAIAIGMKMKGTVGVVIIILAVVIAGLYILIESGIMHDWIDGLLPDLPFLITGGLFR
jgi:hypothetical protein